MSFENAGGALRPRTPEKNIEITEQLFCEIALFQVHKKGRHPDFAAWHDFLASFSHKSGSATTILQNFRRFHNIIVMCISANYCLPKIAVDLHQDHFVSRGEITQET